VPLITSAISSSAGQNGVIEISGSLSGFNMSGNEAILTTDRSPFKSPANFNGILYGPITIASGATLEIVSTSNIKIKDLADA
tara:strand:+ start:204 stop:449 length:246 start_codon:yes stop_codon:yes gene_type:complete